MDSSIWLEADVTRIVWITMLAAMDEDGFCSFSCEENLARRANVTMDGLQQALKVLQSPDRFNAEDEFQGRRIERVADGWMVLKAKFYRNLMSREVMREKTRVRVAEWRAKKRDVTGCNTVTKPVTKVTTSRGKAKQSKANTESATASVASAPENVKYSKVDTVNSAEITAENIYHHYPKKVARPTALRAIRGAMRVCPAERLLELTKAYAQAVAGEELRFIPHPATFFNQQRWNDDPSTWRHEQSGDRKRKPPPDPNEERMERERRETEERLFGRKTNT